jgi:hypothetical protein
MRIRTYCIYVYLGCLFLLVGCAGLDANSSVTMKSSIQEKRVVVIPFSDPYYRGRQLRGIGVPFANVFVTKLNQAQIPAILGRGVGFSSNNTSDVTRACKYAMDNGFTLMITGSVTEWIDGATQWSGKVDVAALTVNLYDPKTCELYGTASARENGTWFTFVDSPTTRFYDTISESIVAKLMQ